MLNVTRRNSRKLLAPHEPAGSVMLVRSSAMSARPSPSAPTAIEMVKSADKEHDKEGRTPPNQSPSCLHGGGSHRATSAGRQQYQLKPS